MKKLFFTLAVMLTASFAFANNDKNGDKNATHSQPKNKVIVQTEVEDDDLYCSITIGENEYTCWFCDCVEFAKQVKELQKAD